MTKPSPDADCITIVGAQSDATLIVNPSDHPWPVFQRASSEESGQIFKADGKIQRSEEVSANETKIAGLRNDLEAQVGNYNTNLVGGSLKNEPNQIAETIKNPIP